MTIDSAPTSLARARLALQPRCASRHCRTTRSKADAPRKPWLKIDSFPALVCRLPAIPAAARRRPSPVARVTDAALAARGVFRQASEWTIDRLHKADGLYVGTVADVRRKMDEFVERINPEYFNFNNGGDLGLMPIQTMKAQVRLFGEQIMPHYR